MLHATRHKAALALTRKLFNAQPRVRRLMIDPTTVADPYPFYREMLAEGTVLKERASLLVVGYDEVQATLRDPRFGHPDPDRKRLVVERLVQPKLYGDLVHPVNPPAMISVNPPAHTRARRLVSRAFTVRTVEAMRPSIEKIAQELLDKAASATSFDVMTDYASPLPVLVIADILGVPRSDHQLFRQWGYDVARTLDLSMTWPEVQAAQRGLRHLNDYFTEALDQRRTVRRDDLLTALVDAEVDGDRLTRQEVLATALLLLVAGFETTVNLIGNGVAALCAHRDQLQSVQQRGEAGWKAAVEETLRYDAPVQMSARIALEDDIEINSLPLRKGGAALVVLGAANRDPRRTPNPNVFDTERDPIEHVSFASGIHFCLGAALARLEGEVALQALFERRPDLDIDLAASTRRPSATLRGFRTMPAVPAGSLAVPST